MAGPRKPRSPYRIRDGQRSLAPRPRAERVLEARRVLRGERVLLRPLASTDLRRCVKWFSDPQIIRFLGRDAPVTLAEEERWFRDYERRTDEQIFAIEVEGQHVGNLGLHKIDRVHRKAEVGIVIGEPSFWSHGYGTEAMRVVLRYGFDVLGLNKISLDVLEYNTRALRTYERLGFQREGVHREDIYKDGRFVNVIRMSILARELREGPVAQLPSGRTDRRRRRTGSHPRERGRLAPGNGAVHAALLLGRRAHDHGPRDVGAVHVVYRAEVDHDHVPALDLPLSRRVMRLRPVRTGPDDRVEGRSRGPVLLHPVHELGGDLGLRDPRADERKRFLEGFRRDVARPLDPLDLLRVLHEPGLHDRLGDIDEPRRLGRLFLESLERGLGELSRVNTDLPMAFERSFHAAGRLVAGLEHVEREAALLRGFLLQR